MCEATEQLAGRRLSRAETGTYTEAVEVGFLVANGGGINGRGEEVTTFWFSMSKALYMHLVVQNHSQLHAKNQYTIRFDAVDENRCQVAMATPE